jgi:hypothetical protein
MDDAVAWAVFQKYERKDDRFHALIASRIIVEQLVTSREWEAENEK